MSEQSSAVNLVLGIIGTITGIIGLFIHFWRFRRENPRIEVKALGCEHSIESERSQISFWATFQMKNLGDRGTSINDVDLVFVSDNKEHLLKKILFRPMEYSQRRWIDPHETIDLGADYLGKYEGEVKEKINCTFLIYHTHGRKKIRALSQRRK
jgi:hypothetical protein